MELFERLCKNCGGDLQPIDENRYKCRFCCSVFEKETVVSYADEMRKLCDEMKLEAISNARRNLYEAVNAEYISSEAVHECCVALKQLIPNDSYANFYEIVVGKNLRRLTKAIRKINVNEDGADIESIIKFLIRSLQTEYQLELNNLIARAFENTDPVRFEKYCTMLSEEAEKVDNGVYETKLPREVFVAYSSKDMEKVSELVEVLEAQGLKCFVAARNLRHGKGAVENYNAAIEEATDHCRAIVFVSSTNSRSFNCDALTVELPYLQKRDLENAPAEYRNNYKTMPQQYKKPRVEYRIGESTGFNVADTVSNEIFDGYERAYTPEEVAERVMKQLVAVPKAETKAEKAPKTKKVKYCVECKSECPENAKFCMNCGGKSFANTLSEAELMQKIAALEKEKAELESRKAEPAPMSIPTPAPISKSNVRSSTGLLFSSNGDKTCFVSGIGTCTDTDVVIPFTSPDGDSVTSIGYRAFDQCSSLTSITIPDSVTSIDERVFDGCSSLTSITIPNSVTSIGGWAFDGCSSLKYNEYDNAYYLGNEANPYLVLVEAKNSDITSCTIHSNTKLIYSNVFNGCSSLTSITIPNSVTSIGSCAFERCSSLESITVDKNNSVYHSAGNCLIETASKTLIAGCKNSVIPTDGSVTSIGNSAFSGCLCSKLMSITIPNSVTSIGSCAFERCSSLTSITIPDSVTSIGESAFEDCSSLTSITIPDSVTSIGEDAFRGCSSLMSITIPDSVTSIGSSAFFICSSLTSITIPNSVTSIGNGAFERCSSLTSITIPDSVTSIGKYAFDGCSSLTSITIPNSVTSIGYSAFSDCSKLAKIIFKNPGGWQKVGGGLFSKIPQMILADPKKAAETLKTKYADVAIERV